MYTKNISYRNSLKLFYFSYWSILVYMFMIIPKHIKDFYQNDNSLLILSLFLFITAFFKPFTLFIKNDFIKKYNYKITYTMFILFFITTIIISFYYNHTILLIISSIVFSISSNYIISYMDTLKLKIYRKYVGKFRIFGSLGGLFMFLTFSFFNINENYYLILLLILISLSFYFIMKKIKIKINKNSLIKTKFSLYKKNIFLLLTGSLLLSFFAYYHSLFYINLQVLYSKNQIYFLLSLGILFEIIGFYISNKIITYKNKYFIFYLSIFISLLRLIGFQYLNNNFYILIIIQTLHLFTMSFFFISFFLILKEKYSKNLNQVMQIYNGISDGLIKSFVLFGFTYLNFSNTFSIMGIILFILLLITIKEQKKTIN